MLDPCLYIANDINDVSDLAISSNSIIVLKYQEIYHKGNDISYYPSEIMIKQNYNLLYSSSNSIIASSVINLINLFKLCLMMIQLIYIIYYLYHYIFLN